jgi:tRNA(fMet)-specific endonuclease VapC
MRYLLDTNTCIAAMRNHPGVVKRMSAEPPDECAISTVTSYELYTGIAKCSWLHKEQAKIDLLLQTVHELPFDAQASREAARLRALLESQGQMIGPYDILLAGHAVAYGVTLVSANTDEFQRVPGLAVENWQVPVSP